jgi:hypothetical protein
MTDYEQQRYQALFDMFETDGWGYLLKDIEEEANLHNNVMATGSADDLFFRKGVLTVLRNVHGLKDTTYAQYNAAKEEEES